MEQTCAYSDLVDANLDVGKVYLWGPQKNLGGEPLSKLLGVGNTGGFRWIGSLDSTPFVVITSNSSKSHWPDTFDSSTGSLRYYGDNSRGFDPYATRGGNKILQLCDERLRNGRKEHIPPFLYFRSSPEKRGWQFLGVFHPNYNPGKKSEWLEVVIGNNDQQFSNLRASFQRSEDRLVLREDINTRSANLGLVHFTKWKRL